MPTPFPSYTGCSEPSRWYRTTITQAILIAAASLVFAGPVYLAFTLAPALAFLLAGVCIGAIVFVQWWLAVRLICLGGDRSEIGAIYRLEKPVVSTPFSLGDYDTDYSFNLLLWPFMPQDVLPQSFVSRQWSPDALPGLIADWPTVFPSHAWADVASQVEPILAQQSMASLNLGQYGQDITPATHEQHFLMHCEIEGAGMSELLTLLIVMMFAFLAIGVISVIPGVGWVAAAILLLLALIASIIAGNAIMNDQATPPSGDFGGTFNSWEDAANDKSPVDIAYVVGRWVYDSFHVGSESNELHPVRFMMKMTEPVTKGDLTAGLWPADLGELKARLDAQFNIINDPGVIEIQKLPENRWTVHPLLDGCLGTTPYPTPPIGIIV
jgi:hypothetical protein